MARKIVLTGAMGLLGRYLLRDLLASGHRVAVLVRDAEGCTAAERLAELLDFWSATLRRRLPQPTLLASDLRLPGLGLGMAERRWLAGQAEAVVHAAACVAYERTPEGEPWETNVNGTRRLLELCRTLGQDEFHHVSTAFVCGDRRGTVYEDELNAGGGTDNAYEQSKFAAEQVVRSSAGIRATIYRPSVIVGDSFTGYTSSYHHFYRFLELAVRLSTRPTNAAPGSKPRRQRLPLRLPLTGEETQNLIPVDWVSQALVALVQRPRWHGRTYHLVAREPVRLDAIKTIIEDLFHLEGIQWADQGGITEPTPLEQLVLEQFEPYWTYLRSNLLFDCRNTCRALPDLPTPRFDRALVLRLLRFAQADRWGRARTRARDSSTPDCAHYLERVLPGRIRHSPLASALPHGVSFALDIRGAGGGQWVCRWDSGEGLEVCPGLGDAAVIYRTDARTFTALVQGCYPPQTAFFDGRIEMAGDVEKGLKLAALIELFLTEAAHHPQERETHLAVTGR
jgi:thioester reductase-like protein